MNMTQRLTARDLIAKSFSAKARRGYDPAEVDAYLAIFPPRTKLEERSRR
jgi:DivIVA domain-containing protein